MMTIFNWLFRNFRAKSQKEKAQKVQMSESIYAVLKKEKESPS